MFRKRLESNVKGEQRHAMEYFQQIMSKIMFIQLLTHQKFSDKKSEKKHLTNRIHCVTMNTAE